MFDFSAFEKGQQRQIVGLFPRATVYLKQPLTTSNNGF